MSETSTHEPSQDTSDLSEAARQISEKAGQERLTLEAQIQAARTAISAYEQERDQIRAELQVHAALVQQLEQIHQQASTHHQAARSYAAMAQDTVGQHAAVTDVIERQKEEQATREALERTRAEASDKNQQKNARLSALAEMIAQEEAKRDQASARLPEVSQVEQQALRQLGESTHATIREQIAWHNSRLAEARASLVHAQVERQALLQEAHHQLEAWPDLQATVKAELPPREDATARIMRAALAYLDQLQADRRQLKTHLLESKETRQMVDWWTLLMVDNSLFHGFQQINSIAEHQALTNRRMTLARVLADYEQAGQ